MTARLASSARIRISRRLLPLLLPFALLGLLCSPALADEPATPSRPLPQFERIVIDDDFPGAYQVEVADVNGDGKPDVVALGGGTCVWYENPSWKKRIVTTPKQTPGVISSATADLDGDGKAEIAIAYDFSMNQPKKGKLLLAHTGPTFDHPWTIAPVADVPSIHRIRWAETKVQDYEYGKPVNDVDPEATPVTVHRALIVAPIFGPSATPPVFGEEPAHMIMFSVSLPKNEGRKPNHWRGGGLGGGPGNPRFRLSDLPIGGGLGGGIGGGGVYVPVLRDPLDSDVARTAADQVRDLRPRLELRTTGHRLSRPVPFDVGSAPVLHAFEIFESRRIRNQGKGPFFGPFLAILAASNLGVTWSGPPASHVYTFMTYPLVAGAAGPAPRRGASEIHQGWLKDGNTFLATVEPWHGTDVAVYVTPTIFRIGVPPIPRTVIDTTLKDGHALWVADVDGDGDDEIFAGYRGQGTSVIGYDFDGKNWNRTVIDDAIAAQDLRGGDIDGDGTPDVVAAGGSTHNVVWYRPKKN